MKFKDKVYQHTLGRETSCSGIGLHSGREVRVVMRPAAENSGIVFRRTDLGGAGIPAVAGNVVDTRLATTLGCDGATVSTTEHLLAALRCLAVDNAVIDIDGPEVPIMDGSASPFVFLVRKAGLARQKPLRRFIRIKREFVWEEGDSRISVSPHDGLAVSCGIEFDNALIRRQEYSGEITGTRFVREIARARTFGFVEDIETLRKNGLALGGSLDNAVVVDEDRVVNAGGLRYPDEFVRHKTLDLVGDLALLGAPLLGHVRAERCGHTQHLAFMQALLADSTAWEYVELPRVRKEEGASGGNVVVPFLVPGRPAMAPGPVAALGRQL